MQTTAFASRSSQILKTSADVVNPKTVKLKLKGLETAFNPPIVHKEELHLALTGKDTMNCLKYVDFYAPGARYADRLDGVRGQSSYAERSKSGGSCKTRYSTGARSRRRPSKVAAASDPERESRPASRTD